MNPIVVLTVVLTVYTRPTEGLLGSCRAARKCCEGKDTDCEVSFGDANTNNIILNLNSETCYCDHGCLDMGDCCHDYKDYCGVYDCQVGDWGDWSPCSASCGQGTQQRRRQVLRPESNGGVSCPDLHQSRQCQAPCPEEEEDATHRDLSPHRLSADKHKTPHAFRETAMILPGKYSQLHSNSVEPADSYDVRQNLKTFHREENTDEYCVVFRVEKAMKSCKFNEDTKKIVRGAEICVSCESKSIRPHLGDRCSGHGVEERITRFKNVISPGCHGKWVKTAVYDKCPCQSGTDFIFV